MKPKYHIMIRNLIGTFVGALFDFVSLSITEEENDVGGWTLKSVTKDACPFKPEYGIVVYRNDDVVYSGIVTKISASYNKNTKTWAWTANGKGDLEYLRHRVIFPLYNTYTSSYKSQYRTFTTNDYLLTVIISLLRENLQTEYNYGVAYRDKYDIIYGVDTDVPYQTKIPSDLNYRLENLYDEVMKLAEMGKLIIRPRWREDLNKIHYLITKGSDKSSDVIFSSEIGNILNLTYTYNAPDETVIVVSDNSNIWEVGHNHKAYEYILREPIMSDNSSNVFLGRENYIQANVKDTRYSGSWYFFDLVHYAENEAASRNINSEGYEFELSSSEFTPVYRRDYSIGDTVSVIIAGNKFTSKVKRVQIDVDSNGESVKPSLGAIGRGELNSIYTSLKKLNIDVTKLKTDEKGSSSSS